MAKVAKIVLASLILGLVLASTSVAFAKGQPVTEILWKTSLNEQAAILQVAQGQADIFAWSSPLTKFQGFDPTILGRLELIRSTSTYYDIAVNPANNVIDPNAPGIVQLYDINYTGQVIPGLVLVNPPSNWVNITDISDYTNLHFNPFALQKARFSLNFLIDRELIVRTIMGGSAAPALGAIRPSHPAYSRLKYIYDELGLTVTGDKTKAVQLFEQALAEANQTLQNYGMMIYYKPAADSPAGKWLYFKKPDGSEERVEVTFVIRVEDERLEIGRQIANWIEKYYGLYVNRVEKERSIVSPVIYGTNPVTTSDAIGGTIWNLYTEGWVSMGEDIDVYARYDVAFFYAPLRGYGPNHRVKSWWYFYDPEYYKLGVDLYYGSYTQENVDKLWQEIAKMLKWGVEQSLRVFITENWEYAPANADRVTALVPGVASGIWTPWALRTLQTVDGKATILEYSSQGALFMSPWNPVLGFEDVYSEIMGRLVRDFAFYNSPINGMPVPIALKGWAVEKGNIQVQGYIYDSKTNQWVPANTSETVPAKVILNYRLGYWHDGNKQTIYDILYWYAFDWEWANDDSTNTTTDPYYDPEISESVSWFLSTIKGIQLINDTTIAIYVDYLDVYDVLIASFVAMDPSMPWYVMSAAERLIASGKTSPSGLPYGWKDREGATTGINFIDPAHAADVKAELQAMKEEGYITPYISTFPGFPGFSNLSAIYDNAIAFINAHNHAFISGGPFYVDYYNKNTNELLMKYFQDYYYPLGYWNNKFELWVPAIEGVSGLPSIAIAGQSPITGTVTVKLYEIQPQQAEESPTDAIIQVAIYKATPNGVQFITTLPGEYIKNIGPGEYQFTIPTDFQLQYMNEDATFYLVITVQHQKSGIAVNTLKEITMIKGIQPTTTTTATTTTTTTSTTTTTPTQSTTTTTTTTSPSALPTVTITTTYTEVQTTTYTLTNTLTTTYTQISPTTITQTVTETNWFITGAIGIVLLVIGLAIGFAIKRK